MAEFSGPWPGQTDFVLDAWRRHGRATTRSGVFASPTAPDLQVTAGTGREVIIGGGQAVVDGMHYRTSPDPTPQPATLTAPENTSSSPRRHLVVLRLDPAAGSITAAIKEGAAASTPVTPSVTQSETGVWELPLADYLMPGSGSPQNPTGIVDRRQFIGTAVAQVSSVGFAPNANWVLPNPPTGPVTAHETGLYLVDVAIRTPSPFSQWGSPSVLDIFVNSTNALPADSAVPVRRRRLWLQQAWTASYCALLPATKGQQFGAAWFYSSGPSEYSWQITACRVGS